MKKAWFWIAAAGLVLGTAATAGAGARAVQADGRWTEQEVKPEPLAPPAWEHAGRILDASGNPVTGAQTLEVRLYGAEEGGDVLWGRNVPALLDENGAFSVRLVDSLDVPEGTPKTLLPAVLAAQPVWIECKISGHDPAMAPRAAVAAAPYALFANHATASRGDFDVAGSLHVAGKTSTQNLIGRDAASSNDVDVAGALHAGGDVSLAGGLEAGARAGVGAVPVGTIILWYGDADDVPDGWALCDGGDGRPDMRGRFPVGAGNQYKAGDTGGEASVTLTVDQLPSHTHGYELRDDDNRDLAHGWDRNDGVWHGDKTATSGSAGKTQPHENRPPFKAIHFIVRVS